MVERDPVKIDVAGSSPASPANFDAAKVMQALIDHIWAEIQHKMLVLGISQEEATRQRMAEIIAEGVEP